MQNLSRRHVIQGLSAATAMPTLAVPLLTLPAIAQDYPTRDVSFVCAFPAGSGADVIVRWYAEKMRPLLGRTVIVENKVGALGNLATEYTARSKPDGHTIYVHGATALAANMSLFKKPPVDAEKEIQIVATINRQPTMLVVRPDAPWQTLAELTAFLKQKGAKASYGTSNPLGRVMGSIYNQTMGLEAVEVIYRTAGDSLNDLTSGALDFATLDNIFSISQEREKRVRILAISPPERMQVVPQFPTMTELGVPMKIVGWFAAMVPMATPRPIVERLNQLFNEVTGSAEGKVFLNSVASDPWITTPDEGQAFLREQIVDWRAWIDQAKIEPQ
ncbi:MULTISPECIES: tripartite tricarboxylate transporter substrate binding protein [unclassified Beijerinckia]|uniref:Bug family tripartite tricarboxylate transporter substrate binding protein n=1 Tax=unclassified Beijerinckia TaxID=2638183 RepID=UPI00089517DE|nr:MULTISPECIES: tripartite tricarboxylate transporter substrate binding protein [unclassified Beijerinckia]MDH7799484.1 tripartite-type tricarboxylate transporter receptor subunit TctC [Beijerinckia sp. GAS462]SED52079.1 Tripartite-type tricarboxylate transporter, receptor component TctC [Beijerinckia sp. 28-YEA-48]